MKKLRLLFIVFVVLMLLALCACNRDGGDGSGDPPTDGSAEEDNTGDDGTGTEPGGTENMPPSGEGTGDDSSDEGSSGSAETVWVSFVDKLCGSVSAKAELGSAVAEPAEPAADGYIFGGWFESSDCSGSPFDFSTPVTKPLTLFAYWIKEEAKAELSYCYMGYESAALEWEDGAPENARVGYRLHGASEYTYIDKPLIRDVGGGKARADIVGLVGGGEYEFIVELGDGKKITENGLIAAYDRSGYAHFGYSEGVGAYTDSGELKEGALVIYLTEENKNDILGFAYVNGERVDISQYMRSGESQYTGIGELLNNRRYSASDRYNVGIAKLCEIYGAVTVRVIGKVTAEQNSDGTSTITGLTDYNSTGNGGSVGDNGRMARMVNARNLTVEGIGEDASIYGWGLHFIANDLSAGSDRAGKSFEVRNIRFESYPEDAVGMEGSQENDSTSSLLSSPVERCWIHHNSFYPGYCASPAESDKAEGDGSCDFKRGRYYTLSYNYFVDCHKTNLVGSSDSSLQFDISFHHNYWENCGSRIPLLRNSNLHFYNNYISCDISMQNGTTGAKLSLSYVSSVRANSYMFSENNYFDGCKNPVLTVSGGAVKAFGNTYYACYEEDASVKAGSREERITNNCAYKALGIDYSAFDTDPVLFYYNAAQNKSDCYLTDAVTARDEVIRTAGTMKRGGSQITTNINKYTPPESVSVGSEELSISLSGISSGDTVSGVCFAGRSSSGTLKGKGQVATFRLSSDTEVRISVLGAGLVNLGELVRSDGEVISGKFTDFSGILSPGIYFIASGSKDKEVTITHLSFKNALPPEKRVEAVEAQIELIPDNITLDGDSKEAIEAALAAYEALSEELKQQITNKERLESAVRQYSLLKVERAEALINAIGEVNEESGEAIKSARDWYDSLAEEEQKLVENFKVLKKAESDYKTIGGVNVNLTVIFSGENPSLASDAGFVVVDGNYKSGVSFTYDGVSYNKPLKMESRTQVDFVLSESGTLKIKLDSPSVRLKISGVSYTADAEGFITVTLDRGEYSITKGDSCNLCYIIVS